MNKSAWIQWLGATIVAAVSGSFILLTYIHANFVPAPQFTDHQKTIHSGAVNQETYLVDLQDLRNRMTEQNQKLDQIIQLMIKNQGK